MKEKMITPDAIISEMEKLRESGQETEQETTGRNTGTDFPIDVLPYKMQRIVREARVTIGFPEDYLAPSMLVAVATAIGNTMMVEHIPGWKENAILFLALVGRPGACKSHPLSYAMQPLIDHDSEMAAQFEKEMRQYLDTLNVPAKKRAEQGLDPNPHEPERKRFIISDITPEAVHRIHSQNKRGLCLSGREVFLVPDLGATEDWCARIPMMKSLGISVRIFDFLERNASEEQRYSGLDIADYLVSELTPQGILEGMMQRNPALRKLVETFDMELVGVSEMTEEDRRRYTDYTPTSDAG